MNKGLVEKLKSSIKSSALVGLAALSFSNCEPHKQQIQSRPQPSEISKYISPIECGIITGGLNLLYVIPEHNVRDDTSTNYMDIDQDGKLDIVSFLAPMSPKSRNLLEEFAKNPQPNKTLELTDTSRTTNIIIVDSENYDLSKYSKYIYPINRPPYNTVIIEQRSEKRAQELQHKFEVAKRDCKKYDHSIW